MKFKLPWGNTTLKSHPKLFLWFKRFRITNIRIFSQFFFFSLFIFFCWATWTSRLGGYPVSRFLEMDPLVTLATALSTGTVYRFLGWSLLLVVVTLLFGRVFCNWMCPYGTLHQFIGWVFNIFRNPDRIEQNRYKPIYFLKYSILLVLLIMAFLGSLQIGILDPICLMYRSVATVFAPLNDTVVGNLSEIMEDVVNPTWFNHLKFAPGVEEDRLFNGSFWIGIFIAVLVGLNLIIPRFFCRVLCPLGALLGVISKYSVFRINRNVNVCTDCNLCLTRCEGASDPQGVLRQSECFSCMNCIDDCPEDALSFTMKHLDENQVKHTPDFSRRKFVVTSVYGLLATPFVKNQTANSNRDFSPKLIRPPGSVEESLFLEKCIKCDQCINVCPTNVLQPAGFSEAGLAGFWTPIMNFKIGHCQLKCNLCSEVCPTGAIQKITVEEKLGKGDFVKEGPIRLGTAFIDTTRCLPHAFEIPCVVCEEVCPVSPKAIHTKDEEVKNVFHKKVVLNKPFIVPDLCIGCGICETECPVKDQRAVYVTAVGETRSNERKLLLQYRQDESATKTWRSTDES